jgi:hypothetical protein
VKGFASVRIEPNPLDILSKPRGSGPELSLDVALSNMEMIGTPAESIRICLSVSNPSLVIIVSHITRSNVCLQKR